MTVVTDSFEIGRAIGNSVEFSVGKILNLVQ